MEKELADSELRELQTKVLGKGGQGVGGELR
jgi:hypothetical protein